MRPTARYVSPREMRTHLLNGAGLGVFLGLALVVGDRTIFNAIVHSSYPRLGVLLFVAGVACFIAVGSAISGFIMTAADKG